MAPVRIRHDLPIDGPHPGNATHWYVHRFGDALDEPFRAAGQRVLGFLRGFGGNQSRRPVLADERRV